MKEELRILGLILAILLCVAINIEAAYTWTDSEGTIHFSDNPPASPQGQKVRVKKITVDPQQNPERAVSSATETNASRQSKNDNKDTGYDSNVEFQLRAVWSEFRNAVARKDANAAANLISANRRDECREGFIQVGSKLDEMKQYVTEIELVYVSGDWAKCRTYREEVLSGKKTRLAFPVNFVKENGQWKIENC